jgi:hypothetical protein
MQGMTLMRLGMFLRDRCGRRFILRLLAWSITIEYGDVVPAEI